MGRAATLARRGFLVGTGAVAAGLAVGTWLFRREPANPLLRELPAGATALNAWVRIDAHGVTLVTPRADMGQGACSVQAALIAEELDLAWGRFEVEPGPPDAAYYNGSVLAEGFAVAATSDSFLARSARDAADVLGKFAAVQVTGGSSTVRDAFDRLRVAGAVARQMLLAAAARRTGLPPDRLRTADGHVLLPDGQRLPYTALAAVAGGLQPPREVALKPASQWRLLGRPLQRLDIVAKSTGTAAYGIDLRLPGMVYATVRTNPRRGGGVRRVDAARAVKARGVLKVVPLPDGAGVIADNTWRAFQAARLLDIEWGAAPYPPTTQAVFEQVAAAFTAERRDSRLKDDGDVDAALQAAPAGQVLAAEYRLPCLAHAPLEPMNAVALLKDGRLHLWTGTQIPLFAVANAAAASGLPQERIHLHALDCGGSFGRRLEDDYVRQAVALAVAHPGAPVKLTWTREEDMTHDFPRPPAIARARGLAGRGQVLACALDIAAPSVTASQMGRQHVPTPGPDVAIVAGAWDQPFAIPHYRVTGYRVPEMMPVSSWRSVGASANAFAHECFLDELMQAAGADPLAERLRLCSHGPSRRVLQALGEISGWGTPLPAGRGRGLAFTLSFGVPAAEVVEVTATPQGIRVDTLFVVAELGLVLDPVNVDAQMAGGALWGLGHAMFGELTYADGAPQQTNFHDYPSLRLHQAPQVVTRALQTTGRIRGIGEPAVPPAAPALANAIFAATGRRIRELPLHRHVAFI